MSETGNLCPLRNSASASCTFLLAHTAAPISVLSSLLQYPSQRAVQKVQSRPCKARTRLDRLAGTTRCVLCCELRRRAAASQKLTAAQPQGPLLPALLRRHKPVASRARGFSPSPQLAVLPGGGRMGCSLTQTVRRFCKDYPARSSAPIPGLLRGMPL